MSIDFFCRLFFLTPRGRHAQVDPIGFEQILQAIVKILPPSDSQIPSFVDSPGLFSRQLQVAKSIFRCVSLSSKASLTPSPHILDKVSCPFGQCIDASRRLLHSLCFLLEVVPALPTKGSVTYRVISTSILYVFAHRLTPNLPRHFASPVIRHF